MVYMTGKAWEEHTACEGKAFEEWERERETIKAKGFEEHRTFEGKAFEEMEWNRLLSRVANPRQQTYLEYTRTIGVERVYIAGKAWEEHIACEGKAFEE